MRAQRLIQRGKIPLVQADPPRRFQRGNGKTVPLQHIVTAAQLPLFKEDTPGQAPVFARVVYKDQLIAESDFRILRGVNFAAHRLRFDPHPSVKRRPFDHDLRAAEIKDILLCLLLRELEQLLQGGVFRAETDARLRQIPSVCISHVSFHTYCIR